MRDELSKQKFRAINYQEDQLNTSRGLLIPSPNKRKKRSTGMIKRLSSLVSLPIAGLFLMLGVGFVGTQAVASMNLASVPDITMPNGDTTGTKPLNYGVQASLSEPGFFAKTREAFIDSSLTFIEIDLTKERLRYFEEGVLRENLEILSKARPGSLCQTPAGLYKVEKKTENHFSKLSQIYQPWNITFQTNLAIHGQPQKVDNSMVEKEFTGDCIRLRDDAAKQLYDMVKVNTPILVYENNNTTKQFLYKPKVSNLSSSHYLLADIESGTVLAASDLDEIVPIASLTKLMTAVVATEEIDLNKSVMVNKPTLIKSLIPRLKDRHYISMYNLLRLLLVESSNEASEVIASQVGREKFINLMNKKATSLKMADTYFADPSGLSSNNVSSLGDLLRLTSYVYSNRKFVFELTTNQDLKDLSAKKEFGDLYNFNSIDGTENFIGGKVGETLAAGQTSISLHYLMVGDTRRVVAVIMLGSENRNEDAIKMLRYADKHFTN